MAERGKAALKNNIALGEKKKKKMKKEAPHCKEEANKAGCFLPFLETPKFGISYILKQVLKY